MSVEVTPNYLSQQPSGGYALDPGLFGIEGWTNLGLGSLALYKDPFGHVFCRGEVTGVAPSPLLVLPAGYRPAITQAFVVECSRQVYASVYADPAGNLVYSAGPALSAFDEIDLSAVHFRAA